MPKQVRHDQKCHSELVQNPILEFDIDLTFGPALAGLKFGI
jgi:hypothetical protein